MTLRWNQLKRFQKTSKSVYSSWKMGRQDHFTYQSTTFIFLITSKKALDLEKKWRGETYTFDFIIFSQFPQFSKTKYPKRVIYSLISFVWHVLPQFPVGSLYHFSPLLVELERKTVKLEATNWLTITEFSFSYDVRRNFSISIIVLTLTRPKIDPSVGSSDFAIPELWVEESVVARLIPRASLMNQLILRISNGKPLVKTIIFILQWSAFHSGVLK